MRTPQPWKVVFMQMARAIADRSKDPSFQAGAVLVNDRCEVLGVGFNGPPPGIRDDAVPWETRAGDVTKYTFITHAEENCILYALAAHGADRVRGATLFVNGRPCPGCVLRMVRAGVSRCVWDDTNPARPRCVDAGAEAATAAILGAFKPGAMLDLVPYSKVFGEGGAG